MKWVLNKSMNSLSEAELHHDAWMIGEEEVKFLLNQVYGGT